MDSLGTVWKILIFVWIETSVFRNSVSVFEELEQIALQNQLLRQFLL